MVEDKLKSLVELVKKTREMARNAPPLDELERLAKTLETMFETFAKFKVDDRVSLVEGLDCSGGWKPYWFCLHKGATGRIHGREWNVDLRKFCYYVEPDDSDLWDPDKSMPSHGMIQWTEHARLGLFFVSEWLLQPSSSVRIPHVRCSARGIRRFDTSIACIRLLGHDGPHAHGYDVWPNESDLMWPGC